MGKKLMIVESPAKAKTIEKYLDGEFIVKSSYGHIRDLDKGKKGIDIDQGFKPNYVVSPDKEKVVRELKALVAKTDEVWLATDEDREGEAISWHLCEVLGLDPSETKRIVFNEITKSAIQKAVSVPGKVDLNLVNAQQARRILDRLVGFELSEVLWRKVRNKLSAGRVQSVAVKLIVEKEREITAFESSNFFKVSAFFTVNNTQGNPTTLKAELKSRLNNREEAEAFLEQCKGATYVIEQIEKKPLTRKPTAPFTTSTLQQEASRKLGFGVRRTMSVAQKLYEQGLITYMRTDGVNLSDTATGQIAERITSNYGEEYLEVRKFKSKSANAQEAHEAIRPTYIDQVNAGTTADEQRLYELIWKRTVASQMAPAKIEKTIARIGISTNPSSQFVAEGEVLKFDGFLKVYLESKDDEDEEAKGMLPPLLEGQQLSLNVIQALERFTRPASRYTEASLVKKLEELGIGRPSTYAPTVSKIMEVGRGYVSKESRDGVERKFIRLDLSADDKIKLENLSEITGSTSNRLYASDIGMVVTDFLEEHFGEVMNYSFTAQIEERFDVIAKGNQNWVTTVDSFYKDFHKTVEETLEHASRAKGRRDLGVDQESGHTVLAQMTRFGPVVQIGTREEVGEEGKPRFSNLKVGQSLESITYEEAMELFKLPRAIGEYKGEEAIISNGRFGPYIKWNEKFVSIPRSMDPLELTFEEAAVLIAEKEKEDEPIGYHDGHPMTKGKGRFGPYIKWNSLFVNIPRRYDPETITQDEALELVKIKIEKEANRHIKKWEDLNLGIENGRWGPFIRFKKKQIKIPKIDGVRITPEQAAEMTLEEVQALVIAEIPGAFAKKATKKKAAPKKKATAKKK